MLNIHQGYHWIPIFDSSKQNEGRDESYWPIGVTMTQLMCVFLKGTAEFPSFFPKPIICELPLRIPFLKLDTSDGSTEETYFRSTLQIQQLKSVDDEDVQIRRLELEMDKSCLLLIQVLCNFELSNTKYRQLVRVNKHQRQLNYVLDCISSNLLMEL